MADKNHDVPPVPMPPTQGAVPPVEPAPVPPTVPAPATPQAGPYAPPQAQQAPYGAPGYAYTPVPAGPVQGLSIASMATGIASVVLSLLGLGFLPGVAAVILGHIAQRRQPYARPFWLTGLITGYVSVAISLIWGVIVLILFLVSIAAVSGAAHGYGH